MPSVLLIGTFPQLLSARREAFEQARYRVFTCRRAPDGIRAAIKLGVNAVVVGHGLSDDERRTICENIKRVRPSTSIVVLYFTSVSGVELADAVLNVTSSVSDLVLAVDDLVRQQSTRGRCA